MTKIGEASRFVLYLDERIPVLKFGEYLDIRTRASTESIHVSADGGKTWGRVIEMQPVNLIREVGDDEFVV